MNDTRDDRLVNIVGALAMAIADQMRVLVDAAAEIGGMAPSALVSLNEFLNGQTIGALHDVVGVSPSGAVRLVDRLIESGYARRKSGTDDRSVSVVLTARGRRAAEQVRRARADAIAPLLRGLNPREHEALGDLVETMIRTATTDRLARRREHASQDAWMCRLCDFSACGRSEGLCPAAAAARSNVADAARTSASGS